MQLDTQGAGFSFAPLRGDGRTSDHWIKIILTPTECEIAREIGLRRENESILLGYVNKHGFSGDSLKKNIDGAGGEWAAVKAINKYFPEIYWSATFNVGKSRADIGENGEVRTRSRQDWELYIRPDDIPSRVFILVTGEAPNFFVHGWYGGWEYRDSDWIQRHGGKPPAWFIPESFLHPISTIEIKQIPLVIGISGRQ